MKKTLIITIMSIFALALIACGKSASDYNKEGMEYYEDFDFDRAEEYLAKATQEDPNSIEYLQNYAMVLIQQGKLDEAIEMFKETISEKDSGSAKKTNKYAYRGLGMAYIHKKDYESAIKYFDKALAIDTKEDWNTDINYYKANAMLLSNDVEGALEIYTKLIDDNSENYLVYQSRADVYRSKGEYSNALDDYNQALLYCEGNFEIYIGMASCYSEMEYYDEADEALFLASLQDIETDEDKYYLGVVHYYQQEYESARAEMEFALANGFTEAYFYLGEICFIQEDYDEALEYFEKYSEQVVSVSATVCNDMAVCYMYADNYETAYEWIQKGLDYGYSKVQKALLRNEVACLEGMGNLSVAFVKLTEYIEAFPDDEAAKTEYEFLKDRIN